VRIVVGTAAVLALCLSSVASAQYGRGRDNERFTRLDPGMTISVRTNELIDSRQNDYRVYTGIVDRDVRGSNGRLAIPRGSAVELIVRQTRNGERNGEMLLDLESVVVDGQRYAITSDPNRIVGTAGDEGIVGSIVGAIRRGEIRGRAVRVPRGTVMTFRLERALDMGVADRGVMRDGRHYHDYYGRGRQ